MLRPYIDVITLTAFTSVVCSAHAVCEESAADDAEQPWSSGVADSRRTIEHGYLELQWTVDHFSAPDYPWQSEKTEIMCWFGAGQRRFDMRTIAVGKEGQEVRSDSQVIFNNQGGFMFRPALDKHAVVVSSAEEDNRTYVEDYDWDFRCLGLAPVSMNRLVEYRLDDVFQMLTRGEVGVNRSADGFVELSSTFQSMDSKEVSSLWRIDLSQGGAVVHASVVRPHFSYTIEVHNREWHPGLWFPDSVCFV